MTQTALAPNQVDTTNIAAAVPSGTGWISAWWSDDQLQGVWIGNASRRDALAKVGPDARIACSEDELSRGQSSLLERLQEAVEGGEVDFSDIQLDLSHLRPFARRVVRRCRRIRRGQTMTYAELAAACGSPNAARAVGNVMRTNRFPLIVPCHRVVGAGGSLGGFSAPAGIELKRRLLQAEGALA